MIKFDFYTLGGYLFWEDVFFYNKWRIQRNYWTKKYRLLDQWDIRRASGSYNECKISFENFAKSYELPKQNSNMIVFIHGIMSSKNSFRKIWREAVKDGYNVASINYPSTRKDIEAHTEQLEFFLDNLEHIKDISFVTHGIGGIILRNLLIRNSKWKRKIKIGNIVQICPPNKGSIAFEYLSKYRISKYLLGPSISELTPDGIKNFPRFDKNLNVGIISGGKDNASGYNKFLKSDNDGLFTVRETKLNNCKHINLQIIGIFAPYYDIVNHITLRFIKNGNFSINRAPIPKKFKLKA